MLTELTASIKYLNVKQKTVYFVLVSVRSLLGFLDVAGIALIGIIAGLASTSLTGQNNLTILGFSFPPVTPNLLLVLVCLVLVLFLLKAVLATVLGKAIASFLTKVESEKSLEIVKYLFTNGLTVVRKYNRGQVLWGVTGSVATAFSGQLLTLSTFISEGVLLLLVAISFALVDPLAALFVVVYFAVLLASLQLVITRLLKTAGQNAATGNVESTIAVSDFINAYREVTVLGKSEYFLHKYKTSRTKLAEANANLIFLGAIPRHIIETGLMLGVVAFVAVQFVTGQLTNGFVTIGVLLTGGVRIMASLLPLQSAIANSKSFGEQAKIGLEMYSLADKEKHHQAQERESETTQVIQDKQDPVGLQISNLSFHYPDSQELVLSDVNLTIEPGQHVAFIGPSGAGKTTLVDLILGLYEPTNGDISLTNDKAKRNYTTRISYVPQKPGMVMGTVAENIALGVPISDIDYDQIRNVLTATKMNEFVDSLPKGVDTPIGEQADSLSGGQIQRIGLARALYTNPSLLILDEATSALDASAEATITETLARLGPKVTVITIAHRLSTVQHSDCVFVIEGGTVSASGTFAQLRKTVPMVAEYVKLMSFDDND